MRISRPGRPALVLVLACVAAACGPETATETASEAPTPIAVRDAVAASTLASWADSVRVVAPEVRGRATAIALSDDGARIAVGASDGTVHTDGPTGSGIARRHEARVTCVAFGPDGDALASGGADGVVRIRGADGALAATPRATTPIVHVEWSTAGDVVLAVALDGTYRTITSDGQVATRGGDAVSRAAFAMGGSRIIAASRAQGTLTIARPTPVEPTSFPRLGEAADQFAPAPDGVALAFGSIDGSASLWIEEGGAREFHRHEGAVLDLAFSPDGALVASASLDGTVSIATRNGTNALTLPATGAPVHRVRLLRDAARILTVAADRSARLWDSAGALVATLGGHAAHVTDAAFVARDRAVLTWSGTGPARLWTLDGDEAATLPGTERGIVRLVASQAGRIAWIAPDRTARVWSPDAAGTSGIAPSSPSTHVVAHEHPAESYSAPERCARCHRPAYDRWVRSSHAWTSTLAGPASLPRDALAGRTVHHSPGSTRFVAESDAYLAETIGTDGEVHRYRLTHVAGHLRMRMLLATMDDGRIQVLPGMTEWPDGPWFDYTHLLYGEPGADLDTPPVVAPGEASFWTGATRSWDQKCAVCHTSGRIAIEPDAEGNGPRSSWRSLGVDCETCHGPGRAHAEAWERGETGTPMERLERLPRDTSIAVCTQCHMEGDRVTPTYRIGDDLYEHLDPTLTLDPRRADPYGRALELIYDGLPFGTSHCAETGGLTCSRCHEPHGSTARSQLRTADIDREVCATCHDDIALLGRAHTGHDPTGSGASCVGCHMPFLTIERGHGAVADHTIGVPVLGAPGDRVATDACTWCHSAGRNAPTDAPRVAAEALDTSYREWWPDADVPRDWMRALAAARTDDPSAGPALAAAARDTTQPRLVRASAARLLDRYAADHRDALFELSRDSDSLVRRAALHALSVLRGDDVNARLREALVDDSAAVRVVAARASLGGWWRVREDKELLAAAIPVLEADVAAITDDYYRWFLLGAARGLAGDDRGALAAYERVLELDPLAAAVRTHVERLRARIAEDR